MLPLYLILKIYMSSGVSTWANFSNIVWRALFKHYNFMFGWIPKFCPTHVQIHYDRPHQWLGHETLLYWRWHKLVTLLLFLLWHIHIYLAMSYISPCLHFLHFKHQVELLSLTWFISEWHSLSRKIAWWNVQGLEALYGR